MRTHKVLRFTAWGVIVAIVFGYVTLIPSVSRWLDAFETVAAGHLLIQAVLFAFLLDVLALWASAVSYSWRRRKNSPDGLSVVIVLLLSNFIGGVFYYFLFVRKHIASHRVENVGPHGS